MGFACFGAIENGVISFHTLPAGKNPKIFKGRAMVTFIEEDFASEFKQAEKRKAKEFKKERDLVE